MFSLKPLSQDAIPAADRFTYAVGESQAQEIAARLTSEYERGYYSGIISERRAKAYLHLGSGSGFNAYEKLVEAMRWYGTAESLRRRLT